MTGPSGAAGFDGLERFEAAGRHPGNIKGAEIMWPQTFPLKEKNQKTPNGVSGSLGTHILAL